MTSRSHVTHKCKISIMITAMFYCWCTHNNSLHVHVVSNIRDTLAEFHGELRDSLSPIIFQLPSGIGFLCLRSPKLRFCMKSCQNMYVHCIYAHLHYKMYMYIYTCTCMYMCVVKYRHTGNLRSYTNMKNKPVELSINYLNWKLCNKIIHTDTCN